MDLPRTSPSLVAEKLRQDPQVVEAKRLLVEAVKKYQQELQGIRPPQTDNKQSYDEAIQQMGQRRGGPLFFPYLGSGIGYGPLVELLDGSVKYDLICGIGTHYLGHSHPLLIESSLDGALSDTVMQGHLQQNAEALELIRLLLDVSGLDHCFVTSSGAMANENALKIAFQKRYPADRILAFERCFAGRTFALAQITDKPGFREGLPNTLSVDYLPFYDPSAPEQSTERALQTLRQHLRRYPKKHAALFFEPVQGEAGFYPGSHDFFAPLLDILKEEGVVIICDEVQTFGRTPSLFAFQHFGLDSYVDIVTIGKLAQVCATLFRAPLAPKPGLLSQTFTSSSVAIRAAIALITHLLNNGYFGPKGKIQQVHQRFVQGLESIAGRYPHLIRGPYGIGAMVAFTPYDGSPAKVNRLIHALFHAGVITFSAGANPTRIRALLPVGVLDDATIDTVLALIEKLLLQEEEKA